MANETVLLKIQADNKQALAAIDKINQKLGKTEEQGEKNNSVFSKMGSILGGIAVAGGLLTIGKHSIKVASDLQEAENKLNAVFGSKGQALVNDFATRYRDDLGMSILQTKNFIADAGNLFNGFGMGEKQARVFSTEVLKLTNDLASFNNLSTEDAQRRMMAALMGESEAAKGLGASILEDQMKRASLALGLGKYSNKMDELTKIQIRYKAILMQSQKAIGDSARSNGSYVDVMKKLNTAIERVSLMMGETLLPAISSVVVALTKVINFFAENIEIVKAVSVALAASATAYGVYYMVVNRTAIATTLLTIKQWELNAAMRANVIGIVVTAIGALIGAMVYFYNTNEKVRYAFVYGWEVMKSTVNYFVNAFIKSLNKLLEAYNAVATTVGREPIELIVERKINTLDDIEKIAKAKSLSVNAKEIVNPTDGMGGSTSTSATGLPFQAGTPANNTGAEGDSYFKTFNSVGDSTTINGKGGTVKTGDITINIKQRENEDPDELLDRLTYKIANEFNRAGKIAGII